MAGVFAAALLAGVNAAPAAAAPLQELTIGLDLEVWSGGSARIIKELGLFESKISTSSWW